MAIYSRERRSASNDEPIFVISVAARLVEMHPQTLRYYERAGLVKPTRSSGHIRLYSQSDIERLRKIARLVDDLGVNLAGVEVILNLTERLEVLQHIVEQNHITLPEQFASSNTGQAEMTISAPAAEPKEEVSIKIRRPRATKTT